MTGSLSGGDSAEEEFTHSRERTSSASARASGVLGSSVMNSLPSAEPVADAGGRVSNGALTGHLPNTSSAVTISRVHQLLEQAATRQASDLDDADIEAAINAALVSGADPGDNADPAAIAEQIGETAAAMTRLSLPAAARRPVDWSGFGALIPVLSASPGAGASVCAAVVVDTLQRAGRCVLLIDASDPARSGLADAAVYDGAVVAQTHPQLTIRYSWRGAAILARLESPLPVITPGMVPPPPMWLPQLDSAPHVTVVDIGHDGWRTAANPLVGAGGWLRRGEPMQRPLLVVRATRPSLRQADQVLARLERWIAAGVAAPPSQLVVMGAKRWPGGVVGAAGRRLDALIDNALFLPADPAVELGGITPDPVGDRLAAAAEPLLAAWGLLPGAGRSRFSKGSQ